MIRFPCPRCDAALKAPDGRAGQKLTCPKCQRAIAVPEGLDDEPPATERDTPERRRVPVWVWVVAALMFVGCGIGAVAVVAMRSGAQDGLTRAERAELDARIKRDLPGAWEEGGAEEKSVYTFSAEGRFEAARMKGGKKVGGHVGTWAVSGARMTLKVTESADDLVPTGKPVEMVLTDVKSEGGKVFRFTLTRSGTPGETRTLTKQPALDLTTDAALTKWLVGRWEQQGHEAPAVDVYESSGQYTFTLPAGPETVQNRGAWWFDHGRLVITIRETSHPHVYHVGMQLAFEVNTPTADRFVMGSGRQGTPYARRR